MQVMLHDVVLGVEMVLQLLYSALFPTLTHRFPRSVLSQGPLNQLRHFALVRVLFSTYHKPVQASEDWFDFILDISCLVNYKVDIRGKLKSENHT